jgi:hypothetical protein
VVWREGDWIFKKVKKGRESITEEYEFFRRELGKDFVAETDFIVSRGELTLKQRFVEGSRVVDYVKTRGLDGLMEMLGKVDFVYRKKQVMADIFGRPHVLGWYDPITAPNVIVSDNGPVLVDVGVARLSKLPGIGEWHNQKLDISVRKLLFE